MRAVAVALLLVAVVTACSSEERATPPEQTTIAEPSPEASNRPAAPAIAGETVDGEAIALGDFQGRPVLVNVWSSW
jgi:hypothetical protein